MKCFIFYVNARSNFNSYSVLDYIINVIINLWSTLSFQRDGEKGMFECLYLRI